jgi:hypothetical protein
MGRGKSCSCINRVSSVNEYETDAHGWYKNSNWVKNMLRRVARIKSKFDAKASKAYVEIQIVWVAAHLLLTGRKPSLNRAAVFTAKPLLVTLADR